MDGLGYALAYYFVFFLFGIIGLALTIHFISRKYHYGYAIAKPIGLLLFAYPMWWLPSHHWFRFNNQLVLLLFFFLALAVALYSLCRYTRGDDHKERREYLFSREFLKYVLIVEGVSIAVFLLYLYVRSFSSDIEWSEKFMDMSLLASAGRTDYFPFFDAFWSVKSVNYYYYGYFLYALLCRLSGTPYQYGYNISLGLIVMLSVLYSFLIVYRLTKSRLLSLLAPALVCFAGNFHYSRCIASNLSTFMRNGNMQQLCSYSNSTRFYENSQTITEFPSYNFISGDLHPHVMAIPFFLLSLYLLVLIYKTRERNTLLHLVFLFVLASTTFINVWEFITLGLVYAGIFFRNLYHSYHRVAVSDDQSLKTNFDVVWKTLKERKLLILFSAILAASPFILFRQFFKHFKSPVQGILFIPTYIEHLHGTWDVYQWPSRPEFFWGVWGTFIILICASLAYFLLRRISLKTMYFPILLTVLSIALVAFTEIFCFADMFHIVNPPFFRGNTVFKFSYHAWILLSIATPIFLHHVWKHLPELKVPRGYLFRYALMAMPFLFIAFVTFAYAYQGYKQKYHDPKTFNHPSNRDQTLDGMRYVQYDAPQDWNVIKWFNENEPNRVVILEAPGGSYFFNGRIAVFTGNGNPENWEYHEWTWRFRYPQGKSWKDLVGKPLQQIDIGQLEIKQAGDEAKEIYTTTDLERAKQLLKKYNVTYVYIGGIEQNYSDLHEGKFSTLGQMVYESNGARLYKLEKI